MKLNEAKIARPIPVFQVSVSSTQPRFSGPIERIVVSSIAHLGESPVGSSTILNIMEQILGWPEMGNFLQDAVNELCSPLVNAVIMGDQTISPMDSPLNNFHLTENGHHILESGIIPAVDHNQDWKILYDTIEKEVLDCKNFPKEQPLGIPCLEKFEPSFPENEIRNEIEHSKEYSAPNVVLGDIQPNGINWLWKTEIISAELKNGKVTIQGKTPASTRFLNGLSPEVIANLFSWSSKVQKPEITNLEQLNTTQITPLANFPNRKIKTEVVFHSESNQNSPFQPIFLEVLNGNSTGVPSLEPGQNGKPAKLHISALKNWNEEMVSNLRFILSQVTARLYFNGTPIPADFVVEQPLSEAEQVLLKNQIIAELLQVKTTETIGPADICAYALLLDSQNEAIVDFLMNQNGLESVLKRIQEYSKQFNFETESLEKRLQEKIAQPSNLTQAITLYHQIPKSLFQRPENFFRDRIAEEIVRSIWMRPDLRKELNSIPQLKPLCELSLRMAELQKRLGIQMLSPNIKLWGNDESEELSILCSEWLALHQKVMKTFSTQENFCEDLALSVQNLQMQAEEKMKTETEILINIRKEFPASETNRTRTQTQKFSTGMRTSDPSRFTNQTRPQRTTQKSRIVFVLDTKALIEFPEILSFQKPAFHLVVPTCVEEKLNQWIPSAPWQAENIERAFELLHRNQIIEFVDHQENSVFDSILAAAADFTHERVFLVTPDPQLWNLAKERNFQILYPSKCLNMLKNKTSNSKNKFENHFNRRTNHEQIR